MKKIGIYKDDLFTQHTNGPGHPECPERLINILKVLDDMRLSEKLVFPSFEPATEEDITRVHTKEYFEKIKATSGKEHVQLDSDTSACAVSFDAALRGSGSLINAVDKIIAGELDTAITLGRPPGHHAEKDRAMGFCLFNHAAVGASHLKEKHGLERVLILDWDVHHGNGTQHIFYDRRDVLYFSVHQFPFYPGTGSLKELGYERGLGYNVNVPVPPMYGDDDYLRIFNELLNPVIEQFRPQFIVVSAGFDAFFIDPLGGMNITANGFARLTRFVIEAARQYAGSKIAYVLEGGYNLAEMGNIMKEVIEELLDIKISSAGYSEEITVCDKTIEEVKAAYSEYWYF